MYDTFESTYREAALGEEPLGVFVGHHRGFLDTAGAAIRAVDTLLFVLPRWGVRFERGGGVWWFFEPGFSMGRFRLERGRSRWRDAEVLRLRYDPSRLPVRGLLYDEIKPLPDGRILGLGGTNHDAPLGDHFWFELESLA